jgi:recombination protein RecT
MDTKIEKQSPTQKALEQVKKTTVKSLRDWIADPVMAAQFKMALPKFFTPERFVRIALTQLTKTPKLMSCTQASVMSCLLSCAELGLEPDGRRAHLIPYGTVCTLIIDYKGLVALARRSGEIADIHADVVCKNDKFTYSFGTTGTLDHVPNLEDRGEVIAAYSFAKLKDGSCSYDVMSLKEIEAIRARSKAGKSGPWCTDWNEMAKKTVFRRHSKWLPVSSEFFSAVDKDFDVPIDITPSKETPKLIESEPSAGEHTEGIQSEPQASPSEASTPAPSGELSEEEKAEILKKEAIEAQKELDKKKEALKKEKEKK